MQTKAIENLNAASCLLEQKYLNASASRLYYSVYQIAVYCLEKSGIKPNELDEKATDWKHSIIVGNGRLIRDNPNDRALIKVLLDLKIRADYTNIPVEEATIKERLNEASNFVKELAE